MHSNQRSWLPSIGAAALCLAACDDAAVTSTGEQARSGPCEIDDGECIFRYDSFGDEQLWTDVLQLQDLVATLPPTAALAIGLKVDADAVPADVLATADLE